MTAAGRTAELVSETGGLTMTAAGGTAGLASTAAGRTVGLGSTTDLAEFADDEARGWTEDLVMVEDRECEGGQYSFRFSSLTCSILTETAKNSINEWDCQPGLHLLAILYCTLGICVT
ncbi:hypothetical protein M5K25_024087 [Dendrobium thyrsiflorum]|uniref:Uncharacterized protein n=1 Tax=Dendrobium thyrsiflorum TaxID=117978 RepID=A0ABD0U107_DENTH